jgi:hypothetical protein
MCRQLGIGIHHRLTTPQNTLVIHIVFIHSGSRIVIDDHTVAIEVCAIRLRLCQLTLRDPVNEFLGSSEDSAAQCGPIGRFESDDGSLDCLVPPPLDEFRQGGLFGVVLLVYRFRDDWRRLEVEGRRGSG